MAALVCNACAFIITTAEQRTEHYKSEWHRYNVKRRCASLLPLSQELFDQKLAALKGRRDADADDRNRNSCALCNKTFSSPAAYQQHLNTKGHAKKEKKPSASPSPALSAAATPASASAVPAVAVSPSVTATVAASSTSTPASSDSKNTAAAAAASTEASKVAEKPSAAAAPAKASKHGKKAEQSHLRTVKSKDKTAKSKESKAKEGKDSEVKEKDKGLALDETHEHDDEAEEGEGDEFEGREAVPLKTCLFCTRSFSSIQDSLDHMLKQHGFFLPFVEYLEDVEGLLTYLGEKVGLGCVCLYCNGRGRAAYPSLHAVRQHMEAKSHCKLRFDTDEEEDEFIDFYRFPWAKDAEEGEDGEGDEQEDAADESKERKEKPAKPADKPDKNAKLKDDPSTADIAAALADIKLDGEVDTDAPKSRDKDKDKASERALIVVPEKKRHLAGVSDAGELVLSDGAKIGHRSMWATYRQNVRPSETRESVLINQMMGAYKALALPGYANKSKHSDWDKRAHQLGMKQRMRAEFAANTQKHFRSQQGGF